MKSSINWISRNKGSVFMAGLGLSGILIAIFFGLAALDQRKPIVAYEILNETDVLDVRTPLDDLNITFRGTDIQKDNLNLRVFSIRVINSGNADVLQPHYDQAEIWGVKFEGAEVIEARLVSSSSEYLGRNAIPNIFGGDSVEFPKVILEDGNSFSVEILAIHTKDFPPLVLPLGKIAGVDEINVLRVPLNEKGRSFFDELIPGGWLVQVARIALFIVALILAIVVSVLAVLVVQTLNRFFRNIKINRSVVIKNIDDVKQRDGLRECYRRFGKTGLKVLKQHLDAPQNVTNRHVASELSVDSEGAELVYLTFGEPFYSARNLESIKAVDRSEDGRLKANELFLSALNDVMAEFHIPHDATTPVREPQLEDDY